MFPNTIFDYITQQENLYQSSDITLGDNWRWSMRNFIQLIFHLKNSQFYTGNNDWTRAFKQIMETMIDLANWTEDLEVKDVVFYIENSQGRVLSFFIKKYHDEVYVKEHDIDELLDEITENDNTYGGVLIDSSQKKKRPKAIKFTNIAFCDQMDMMSSPIGFKFYFSPSQLMAMEKQGWGKKENGASGDISELITNATFDKEADGSRRGDIKNQVPGKQIEVYMVRGPLAKAYLNDDAKDEDFEQTENALFVVAFYYDAGKKRQGFILYRKPEEEGTLKFFTSKEVEGRALGRGVGEQMLQAQIWTNFLEIHKQKMIEAGAKVPLVTDDENFANRQQIQDMETLEITTIAEGRTIKRIETASPVNIRIFQDAINQWFEHAQYTASAFDSLVGKEESSGITFRGQERLVAQGRGPHDRKRGKRAKFIEKIYREDIIPEIKREILNGKKFLSTLDFEEMQWVTKQLAENYANKERNEDVLNGKDLMNKEELIQEFALKTQQVGNKWLLKILKDEFRDVEVKIGINVAGKQKNLSGLSDKVLSIFQMVFANPQAFQQAMQIPALAKSFNDILEFSGISQVDFSTLMSTPIKSPMQPQEGMQQSPEMQLSQPANE